MTSLATCADCHAPLDPTALTCPALTHAQELESLAAQAREASLRHDLAAERDLWERSSALLPSDTVQYRSIRGRVTQLTDQIDAERADASRPGASAPGSQGQSPPQSSAGKWGKGAA